MNKNVHLWEVAHQYYCSDTNYYSNATSASFESFDDFLNEEGDADLDYNLVFRWDWDKPDNEDDEEVLSIFFIGQRKGLFRSARIIVKPSDEPAVIKYLEPRFEHLKKLWLPIGGAL